MRNQYPALNAPIKSKEEMQFNYAAFLRHNLSLPIQDRMNAEHTARVAHIHLNNALIMAQVHAEIHPAIIAREAAIATPNDQVIL